MLLISSLGIFFFESFWNVRSFFFQRKLVIILTFWFTKCGFSLAKARYPRPTTESSQLRRLPDGRNASSDGSVKRKMMKITTFLIVKLCVTESEFFSCSSSQFVHKGNQYEEMLTLETANSPLPHADACQYNSKTKNCKAFQQRSSLHIKIIRMFSTTSDIQYLYPSKRWHFDPGSFIKMQVSKQKEKLNNECRYNHLIVVILMA